MKCVIQHMSEDRMRVHVGQAFITPEQACILEKYLMGIRGVSSIRVSERTGNAVICFHADSEEILHALSVFHFEEYTADEADLSGRKLTRDFEEKVFWHCTRRVFKKLFLPVPIRNAVTVLNAVPYVWNGLKTLVKGRIEVPVLDGTTIGVSVFTGDFATASSIMFLLGLSEILEDYTHRKSVDDLARSMALNIDKVWILDGSGEQILMNVSEVHEGDIMVVHSSNTIPLDGIVVSGEMTVNQSSMTGESVPSPKEAGSPVYAGTVVEEGECRIRVTNTAGSGRYDRIVKMIEESEKLKSETEAKAIHLADRLVPYSFAGTIITYLLTRNTARALAVLMVDYSCALKLSIPISVLSAMRECARHRISVKGGQFLENIAAAETVVFDKTGTLTYSRTKVAMVIPFGKNDENEMLRLAACLEEHYPHSMANAVVAEAENRGLMHAERHTKVEYIVAHGIASTIDGQKAVIGSRHFVFEDEGVKIPAREKKKFEQIPDSFSHLYLAVGGKLAAVICIEDPIRPEVPAVIGTLKRRGICSTVMMTGDSLRTAASVAAMTGVDRWQAEVLPEDKAAFIKEEHAHGRKVIMLGDGINDSPALSEADCGIAVSDGAAIAREIADVTIADDDLNALIVLKDISDRLDQRIHRNYRFIMAFNTALIVSGAAGILPAASAAWLHNISTLAVSLHSMTDLLDEDSLGESVCYPGSLN
ncbi:MAG: heavy metal translocating P-type ATPase [Solobacterium sp.]|nr:heavy metal translocating P-type ATPase [Solobacterium sp.]